MTDPVLRLHPTLESLRMEAALSAKPYLSRCPECKISHCQFNNLAKVIARLRKME